MIQKIQLKDAETRFHELILQSVRGDHIIIMMGENPVAQILPFEKPKPRRRIGTAKNHIVIKDDFKAVPEAFKGYIP